MSVESLRKMNQQELVEELSSSQKELFNLRMQKGSGQLSKPHLIPAVKIRIAQLHTLITEKSVDAR